MSNPFLVVTDPINAVDRVKNYGILASRAGTITLDVYNLNSAGAPEPFKFIRVGTAGDVVIELLDGTLYTHPAALAGEYIPVPGWRVMASGTNAGSITWFGGTGASRNV